MNPAYEILHEDTYNRLWWHWYNDPLLQQLRKIIVKQCISDIELSMTWSKCNSPGESLRKKSANEMQLSIEKRLRNTLKHNLGSIIDWLCVVGVCPLAEQNTNSKSEGCDSSQGESEQEPNVTPVQGLMCFVPHHTEVEVFTSICPSTGMWKLHTQWKSEVEDCLGFDFAGTGLSCQTRKRKSEDGETSGRGCSRLDMFSINTYVPGDVCMIDRQRIASQVYCAMPILEQLRNLESCYLRVNVERSRPWHFLETVNSAHGINDVSNSLQYNCEQGAPVRGAVNQVANVLTANDDARAAQVKARGEASENTVDSGPASSLFQVPTGFKTTNATIPPGPADVPCTREYYVCTLSKIFMVSPHLVTLIQYEQKRSNHGASGTVNQNMVNYNENKLMEYWAKSFTSICSFIIQNQAIQNDNECENVIATSGEVGTVHVVRRGEHVFKPDINELMAAHVLGYVALDELESVIRRSAGLSSRVAPAESQCQWSNELQVAILRTIAPSYEEHNAQQNLDKQYKNCDTKATNPKSEVADDAQSIRKSGEEKSEVTDSARRN